MPPADQTATGHSSRRAATRRGRLAAGLAAVAMLALLPAAALAQDPEVELSLRPIGQPGSYFDLVLGPGDNRTLEVELGNVGASGIAVRTYVADVYTIVNGGFGAELRDEPASGPSRWLDYPTEVIELPPGQGVRRTFTVRVPADAAPGEYITSLILENERPIGGGGDVAIQQILRQAMAVVISVPGPRRPGLTVGAATHTVVGERSVVAVVVRNTGNVRLKPVAEFVLRDAAGVQVSRSTVAMDTFYAGTETRVEVPLAALLEPASYTVSLSLDDAVHGVRAEVPAIPLGVEAPPVASGGEGIVPELAEVVQSVGEGRVPSGLVGMLVIVGAATAIGLGLLVGLVRRRGRRPRRGDRPDAS